MEYRICNSCGEEKDIDKFPPRKDRGVDARHGNCRNCETKRRNHIKEKYPWYATLKYVNRRCNNPNHHNHANYHDKGIKNLLTLKDLEFMWFRDGAYLMERPTIDRINPSDNYCMQNCEYVEFSENMRRRNNAIQV